MDSILSPERVIDRLVAQPLFADLDPVSLRVIALASEVISLEPGTALFSEGQVSDSAYFILSGSLSLSCTSAETYAAESGDLIHPLALITDLERPATASATEFSQAS